MRFTNIQVPVDSAHRPIDRLIHFYQAVSLRLFEAISVGRVGPVPSKHPVPQHDVLTKVCTRVPVMQVVELDLDVHTSHAINETQEDSTTVKLDESEHFTHLIHGR